MSAKSFVSENREKYKGMTVAFCNSKICTPRLGFKSSKGRKIDYFKFVIKDVRPGTLECPDCNHILVWRKF